MEPIRSHLNRRRLDGPSSNAEPVALRVSHDDMTEFPAVRLLAGDRPAGRDQLGDLESDQAFAVDEVRGGHPDVDVQAVLGGFGLGDAEEGDRGPAAGRVDDRGTVGVAVAGLGNVAEGERAEGGQAMRVGGVGARVSRVS